MSLQTNAKTISICILIASLVLVGLVGYMSINSTNNITAHAESTVGDFYNIDNLTLDYSNVQKSFSKPQYRIINANDNLSYNDYRGLFSFSLAHSEGDIRFAQYSMSTEDYGFHGLSRFVQYQFKGTIFYNDRITLNANPNCQVNFIYSCASSHYRPSVRWHFLDAGGMLIINVQSVSTELENRTNTLIPIQLSCPSQSIPSNAQSYFISLVDNSKYFTMYSFYPYITTGSNLLTYADKDIGYLIDLYELAPDNYWHTRYLASQENLRLAQEEGATLNGALESITTAPINALAEFMDFELPFFNINLGTILAILISLMLVGFVIKILISKG